MNNENTSIDLKDTSHNTHQKWHDLAVCYAKNWDTKRKTLDANCTILDEVTYLAVKHLSSVCVPPTIVDQIPVFTDWADENLSPPLKRARRNSLKKL